MKNFSWILGLAILMALLNQSCKSSVEQLSGADSTAVAKAVSETASNIARDISNKGPVAWLDYFEDNSNFFMASGGALTFKNYATGKSFTATTVAKSFKKIELHWTNFKIDPLTKDYASFGADFHENITPASGQELYIDGYVTATMHFDGKKWKIRNLNWSIIAPADVKR